MGLAVVNRTSCGVHHQFLMARGVEETLLVLVRASHDLREGRLAPTTPAPIVLADTFGGEADRSSLVAASDVVLFKPATDLLFSGCAYPVHPGDRDVLVRVAVARWEKHAVVSGDRVWRHGLGRLRATAPEVMDCVPLVFERAFGGHDPHADPPAWSVENPAGAGYVARSSAQHDGRALPNIEYPKQRLSSPRDRPAPCAFGPVARHWEPRRRLLGTFDLLWQQTRAPLPPSDIDPQGAQVAPTDQIYAGRLLGGEAVTLDGMRRRGGRVAFRVPFTSITVAVHDGRSRHALPVVLDTLHVDAEALRVDLTWRASISVHGWLDDIEWILVTAVEGAMQ